MGGDVAAEGSFNDKMITGAVKIAAIATRAMLERASRCFRAGLWRFFKASAVLESMTSKKSSDLDKRHEKMVDAKSDSSSPSLLDKGITALQETTFGTGASENKAASENPRASEEDPTVQQAGKPPMEEFIREHYKSEPVSAEQIMTTQ
ncbi:hypothetical protein MRB53_039865 [Persea americana]|nr:hypothetical protein MRB53_039865 [Persea americana]